jgi:glycosyltransferase involved in cell wall biosynthesis
VSLRVGVNLTWIAPGRVGGSEEYLSRQLLGLPAAGHFDVSLFCTPTFAAAHPDLTTRFRVVATPFDRDNRALRIALEHSWLPAQTRDLDLVHHGGGTMPLIGRRPTVLTVHDLQYLEFPEYFSESRRRYLDRMMSASVDRASVIATPTEFVRQTVLDAFGVDTERVVVVPHGVPVIEHPAEDSMAAIRRRYGIGDGEYVVYPAITHPHKRHGVLVDMLGFLDDDLALVLLGGVGSAEPALLDAIVERDLGERVVRTGRVSAADRDGLIAGAAALVFPSQYEGVGAPLVEAMELGVPVVAGDVPAVREVVGDAAIIVEDESSGPGAAWAAGVADARRRRDELERLGRERRRAFTLEVSGRALAAAYEQAVGDGATT